MGRDTSQAAGEHGELTEQEAVVVCLGHPVRLEPGLPNGIPPPGPVLTVPVVVPNPGFLLESSPAERDATVGVRRAPDLADDVVSVHRHPAIVFLGLTTD